VSVLVYASIVGVLLLVPQHLLPLPERRVDVAFVDTLDFVEQVAKPEPPPPPPPPPEPEMSPPAPPPPPPPVKATPKIVPKPVAPPVEKPKLAEKPAPKAPPAAAAPIVRPEQKVRRLDRPPPLKEFRAPREIPTDVPKEADPSEDKGVAVYGEPGRGDPAGLEGGVARGGVAGGSVGGVVELPDGAQPPRLLAGATIPAYPPEARADRKTGVVVLKAIVYADGTVGDVRVIEGEEPFASAAVRAVRSWRYEPARLNGQPIAVYREIRIPFKLAG
jgi:periplasmic protein TonB